MSLCSSHSAHQDTRGYDRLKQILNVVLLRRTKLQTNESGSRIIDLPPRTINIVRLQFSPDEQELYTSLFSKARDKIMSLLHSGSVLEHYAHVLLMLLRLRQVP